MRSMLILTSEFVLCRSDRGDGGWSLHAPKSTDENIAAGNAPPLVSGESTMLASDWTRPNDEDYRKAAEALAPWATEIVPCDGGYQAFEAVDDATMWQRQV